MLDSKKRTGIVYAFINKINNKMYIGKTINEYDRLRRHCKDALINTTPFYCAIRKYGWIHFDYVILYKTEGFDKFEIDSLIKQKEKEFIVKYNSTMFGYNLSWGGDGSCGHYPSQETRNKMSKTHTGLKHSAIKMDNAITKRVLQFDLSGNFIKEYFSIAEASRCIGAKEQHISRCCYGQRKKTRGFVWKFKNNS
jgi:hypothetical protein